MICNSIREVCVKSSLLQFDSVYYVKNTHTTQVYLWLVYIIYRVALVALLILQAPWDKLCNMPDLV